MNTQISWRTCLRTGLMTGILYVLSDVRAATPEPPAVRTFLDLEAFAATLAQKAYQAPDEDLDPFFSGMDYDDHRRIQFRKDKTHFVQEGPVGVEFFHPGWMYKKPVHFYEILKGQPESIPFDPEEFDYFGLTVPEGVQYPSGYTGFKVLAVDRVTGNRPEFLAFNGASYFRAVGGNLGWGLSARGVAVNTLGGKPEEFPDFTHFWFCRPEPGDKTFRFLALLNGASITGAYEFEVEYGETTTTRVKASLYLRNKVEMLGVAPFSSMFWFGENTQPKPLDFRGEVHDSDGLLIEQEHGPVVWRPLDNGKEMRHSIFAIDHLKGFGLQERDRDFLHFQDLEARYHERTAAWVEPLDGFGRGKLHLIELPTGEETWDNVVLFWEPESQPTSTQPLRIAYNLHWQREQELSKAKVTATRWGKMPPALKLPDTYKFIIDYSGVTLPPGKTPEWKPVPEVHLQSGEASIRRVSVIPNPEAGGWRVQLELDIASTANVLELTCDLMDEGRPLSERWNYQWRRQ